MSESKSPSTPQRQAMQPAGKGGIVPPVEHRWQPGQSGNPGGAPLGQVYPGRWLGPLSEQPVAELRRIMADEQASASKRAAARLILDALDAERPEDRRRALGELMNRTQGRARQTHVVEQRPMSDGEFEQRVAELRARLGGPNLDDDENRA